MSFVLGAGETTLLRMTAAYAMFDNGGKKIVPTLIDRIQDRYGRTIYRHDQRECRGCEANQWAGQQQEPTLVDRSERVIDAMTAYQITSMMEGVVVRGTAAGAFSKFGKPVAGKTGTTNDEKDAWFIGFTPEMVVGVYMGYDKPRHLGRGATGGRLAAPIVKDFMKVALADKPAVPFRVPAGIKLIRVDPRTGQRVGPGFEGRTILEAFKPGTAPPDTYSVVGYSDQDGGRTSSVSPDADRAVRSGTGGLY
jgi:penicillin-binding protein 1A